VRVLRDASGALVQAVTDPAGKLLSLGVLRAVPVAPIPPPAPDAPPAAPPRA